MTWSYAKNKTLLSQGPQCAGRRGPGRGRDALRWSLVKSHIDARGPLLERSGVHHMTKRWLIALFIAGLFGDKAFADCVPSPDTPASVIEYFRELNKPLPEQFCAKEDATPQGSEEPSQEPPEAGPSKCEMTLAATRNALATLGRLEKTLDAAAALTGATTRRRAQGSRRGVGC